MKRILILAAILSGLLFSSTAHAWSSTGSRMCATISKSTADTVSVLLAGIRPTQRYLIKNITLTYDNASNVNPIYAMLQLPSFSRTVYFQTATNMTSAGSVTLVFNDINVVVPAPADSTAGGLIFFLSAATSDTLSAVLDYEVLNF